MRQGSFLHYKTSRKRSGSGFSLVEVLFAVSILAFALLGILVAYIPCAVLAASSKNVNIAINAALGLVEEIRSSAFTRVMDDYNGLNFIVNDIPSNKGVVYVDDDNPELLKVTISVCWQQGSRIIGEDLNLDGVLGPGEDINGNGIIDSTVQLVALIANR